MHGRFNPESCFISYRSEYYSDALVLREALGRKIPTRLMVPPASCAPPTRYGPLRAIFS